MLWAARRKMAIVLAPKIASRSSMIRRPSAIWYRICMMLSVLALSKCGKVLVGQMRLPTIEQLFWKSLRSVSMPPYVTFRDLRGG